MEEPRIILHREDFSLRGIPHLIDEPAIAPRKEPILRRSPRSVPPHLPDVIQRRALRKVYLAHGFRNVQKAGESLFLLVEKHVVARRGGSVVSAAPEKRVARIGRLPPRVDKAESRII